MQEEKNKLKYSQIHKEEKTMLTEQKITNEQVNAFAKHELTADLEIGNSRFGIGIIMAMAGFIGAWGCVCLISGITQTHNLHEFGHAIITAFTGI